MPYFSCSQPRRVGHLIDVMCLQYLRRPAQRARSVEPSPSTCLAPQRRHWLTGDCLCSAVAAQLVLAVSQQRMCCRRQRNRDAALVSYYNRKQRTANLQEEVRAAALNLAAQIRCAGMI